MAGRTLEFWTLAAIMATMKRITKNGIEYAILPCPECRKGRFLYPMTRTESKGYCETCGHKEEFKVEKNNDLRKGKR